MATKGETGGSGSASSSSLRGCLMPAMLALVGESGRLGVRGSESSTEVYPLH